MLCYLNGDIMPADEVRVSPFDRGFLFGDAVYEGLRATRGRIVALERHLVRLGASLAEAEIDARPGDAESAARRLVEAAGADDAFIYLQISRGAPPPGAPWRERIPSVAQSPTVFAYLEPLPPLAELRAPGQVEIALRPDTRWTRCHVKSTSLMGNVIAALEARRAGAADAVMVRDGLVSEGTSTNVFASIGGRTVTPSLDSSPMLQGVTRGLILGADPSIEERPVSADELRSADEVMLVGTRTAVASVSAIDGRPTPCAASPGPASRALLAALLGAIERDVHSADARR